MMTQKARSFNAHPLLNSVRHLQLGILILVAMVFSLFVSPTVIALPSAAKTVTSKSAGPSPKVAIEKITSVEGITEYRLPNGLKVLLFPDQSKPTVTVNVTYLVG